MQLEGGLVEVFEAEAAAERLSVSPSGLRRLAVIYEQVHGELPRKGKTGRLYSGEVLGQLEAARAMVEAERYPTIKEALQALERGELPDLPAEVATGARAGSDETLRAVVAELREVRAELAALRSEVATGRALPEGERATGSATGAAPGVLVRVAMWLEQRLRLGGRKDE